TDPPPSPGSPPVNLYWMDSETKSSQHLNVVFSRWPPDPRSARVDHRKGRPAEAGDRGCRTRGVLVVDGEPAMEDSAVAPSVQLRAPSRVEDAAVADVVVPREDADGAHRVGHRLSRGVRQCAAYRGHVTGLEHAGRERRRPRRRGCTEDH